MNFQIEKSKIISKLSLGTVQFGLDYGISNVSGKTEIEEVSKILKYAYEIGISTLDTASAYGECEEVLGKNDMTQFNVISKFSNTASTRDELFKSLKLTLQNLKIDSIYGYLAHDANSLLKFPVLWDTLQEFKQIGLVQKIGYSLYMPEQLDHLLKLNYMPDLIQIPYNLIDQRFKEHLPILKSYGCEIHARSVFLQGLFFMESEKLSTFFNPIKPLLLQLKRNFADFHTLASFLLNNVLHNPHIDSVVFGVNTEMQLKKNIKSLLAYNNKFKIDWDIKIPDEILLPHKWPN